MSATYEVLLHFMGSRPVSPADTTNGPVSSTFSVGADGRTDSGTFTVNPSVIVDWRCHFSFLPQLEDMRRAIKRHKCANAGDDGHMSLLVKSIEWPTKDMQPGESIIIPPVDAIKPFLPLAYVQITRLEVIHMPADLADTILKSARRSYGPGRIPKFENVPYNKTEEDGPTY